MQIDGFVSGTTRFEFIQNTDEEPQESFKAKITEFTKGGVVIQITFSKPFRKWWHDDSSSYSRCSTRTKETDLAAPASF